MTHHTSDSWPIYRVTCSISIKHVTVTRNSSIQLGGKYELMILWGYIKGREERDDLAVKGRITGAPSDTSNMLQTHNHTFTPPVTLTAYCASTIMCVCICSTLQAATLHCWLQLAVYQWCVTLPRVEDGQPDKVVFPEMFSSGSHHRKTHLNLEEVIHI